MTASHAQRVDVPKALADSQEFRDAHYASAYEAAVPDARATTPEQWGRAVFEGAPAPVRGFLTFGWTQVLRLRLGDRGSREHVLGWHPNGPISTQDDAFDSLVLEGRSGLVTAYNVVVVRDASVLWATAVHFRRPAGRVLWRTAQPIHQIAIPALLKRAGRSLSRPD